MTTTDLVPGLTVHRYLNDRPDGGYLLTILSRPWPSRDGEVESLRGALKVRVVEDLAGERSWFGPQVREWYVSDLFGYGRCTVEVVS